MLLAKKVIIYVVTIVIIISSFSGCILNEILGTSFSLTFWNIGDEEGFPGISIGFTSSGITTVKTFDPDGTMLDSELFLRGNNDAFLHLAPYRESVTPGDYSLKAYDKNDNVIFEKELTFSGSNISVLSCDQRWWKRNVWSNDLSLIGLEFLLHNDGDVPVYPYTADVTVDSETFSSLVLPCNISPGESKYAKCFIFIEDTPSENTFCISLQDSKDITLAENTFPVVLEDNVDSKEYNWKHGRHSYTLRIPYPDYLYDYYNGLDRSFHEDYGMYVFNSYDEDYLNLVIEQLLYSFYKEEDIDIINYAASFIQNLEYKLDNESGDSQEYPRYPVETLFNDGGGGDCEDLSILAASILDQLGYHVALIRLPEHMAVGVKLDQNLEHYDYFTEDYYFLETTNVVPSCGYVPSDYKNPSELNVYPLSSRALLLHSWKNGTVNIYKNTDLGDFVKVTIYVKNEGSTVAENIRLEAGFYTGFGTEVNAENKVISSLDPEEKKKAVLMVDIPRTISTKFETRVYLDGERVDETESASYFP